MPVARATNTSGITRNTRSLVLTSYLPAENTRSRMEPATRATPSANNARMIGVLMETLPTVAIVGKE
ncbi:hypothetical protein D3C85_1482490 [compost metagenome]